MYQSMYQSTNQYFLSTLLDVRSLCFERKKKKWLAKRLDFRIILTVSVYILRELQIRYSNLLHQCAYL